MTKVRFVAHGHSNVIGHHKTTIELTSDETLTTRGTCIVGVRMSISLSDLDQKIRKMVQDSQTQIILRMTVEDITEIITGYGSSGLMYRDETSMVVRTSTFECDRTLMVRADKAASDLDRKFIRAVTNPDAEIQCELEFIR